jgi:Domain of unknown function (DUF4177)
MLPSKLKFAALLFVLMAGAAVFSSRHAAGQQPSPPTADKTDAKVRIKWEYKALSYDEIKALEFNKRGTDTADYGLNMLGDEGWELVAIEPPVAGPVYGIGGRPALYVFKRAKK